MRFASALTLGLSNSCSGSWGYLAAATCWTSAISEISLHLAAKIFPRVDAFLFPASFKWLISDSDLIYRGNPLAPGNDANGFRNANIPSKAEIVAIGDSHTYGAVVHFGQPSY
jgi:hypothetical protein